MFYFPFLILVNKYLKNMNEFIFTEAWRGREERGDKTRGLEYMWMKREGERKIESGWKNGKDKETGNV